MRQSYLQLALPDGSHRKVWCKLDIAQKVVYVFNSNNTREDAFMIIDLGGMEVKMLSGTQTRFVISSQDGDYHNRDDDFEFTAPSFKAASSWLTDISNSIKSKKSVERSLSNNTTNEDRVLTGPEIQNDNANVGVIKENANMCVLPNFEKQIRGIYEIYNPDKLGNVPNIVKLYDGEEMSLLVALQKKYSITDYSLLGGASSRMETHFFEERKSNDGAQTTAENIAAYKSYHIKSKGEAMNTYNTHENSDTQKEVEKEENTGLSLEFPVVSTRGDQYDLTDADRQNSSLPRSTMEVHMNDDRELLKEAKVSMDSVHSLVVGEDAEEVSFDLRDDRRTNQKTSPRNPLRIETGDDSLLVDSSPEKHDSLRDRDRSESRGRKAVNMVDSNMSAKGLFASYSVDDSIVQRSPSPLRSREREVKPKKGKDMAKVKPKVNTNNARSKSRDKGGARAEDLHEREWVGATEGNNRYTSKKYAALDKDGDGRILASRTSPSRQSMQYPRRASLGGKRKSWIANTYGNSVMDDTHHSFNKKLGHTHENRSRSRIQGQNNLYYVEDGDSPSRYQQFLGQEDNVPFGGMDGRGTGHSEKSRYTDDMSLGDDEIDRQLMLYMEHGSPRNSPSPTRRGRHDNDVQYVQEDQASEYRQQMMEWQRGRGRSASQSGSSAGSPSLGRSGSRSSRSGSRGRNGNNNQGGSIEEKFEKEQDSGQEKEPSTGFRSLGKLMNRMFFGTTAKQPVAAIKQQKRKSAGSAKKVVQIQQEDVEEKKEQEEIKSVLPSPPKQKPTYWERIKSAISPPLKNKEKEKEKELAKNKAEAKKEDARADEAKSGYPDTPETSSDDREAAAKRKSILDEVGEIEKGKIKKMASSLDRNFKFKSKGKVKSKEVKETYNSNKGWSDNLRSSSISRRSQSPANKKAASWDDKDKEKKKKIVGIKPRGRDASPWAPTSAGRSSALEASKQKQVSGIMKEKLKNRFGFSGSFGSAVVDDYLASPVGGIGSPKLLDGENDIEDNDNNNRQSQSQEKIGGRGRPASTPAPRNRGVVKKVKGVDMVTDSSGMFAIKKTPSFFDAMKAKGRSLSPGKGTGFFKGDMTDGMISPTSSIGSPTSRDLGLELSSPSKILGPYSNKRQTKETETAELNRMTSWLKSIKMDQYAHKLVDNGVNKISMIELLEVEDLLHAGLPLSDANTIRSSISEVIQRTRTVSEAAMLSASSSPVEMDSSKVASSSQKPSRIPFAVRPKRVKDTSGSPRGASTGRQALFPPPNAPSSASPTRHLNMNKKIKPDSRPKIGRPLFGKSADVSGNNDREAPQKKPALPKFNIVRRPSAENTDLSSATAGYSPPQRGSVASSKGSNASGASSHGGPLSAQYRRSSRARKEQSIEQISKVHGGLAGFGSPKQRKEAGSGTIVMGQTSNQAMKYQMKQYQAVLKQKLNPKQVKSATSEARNRLQQSSRGEQHQQLLSLEGSRERYVGDENVESPEDVITEEERREIEEAKMFVAAQSLAERSSPPTQGRGNVVSNRRSVSMPRSSARSPSIHAKTALFGSQYQVQQQLELNPVQVPEGFGGQVSPGMSPVKVWDDSSPSERLISDLYTPQIGGHTPALQDAALHDAMRQHFFPGSKKMDIGTSVESEAEAMDESQGRGREESKKVARRRSLSQPLFPVRQVNNEETADVTNTPDKHHGQSGSTKKHHHKEEYDNHLQQKRHLSRLKLQQRLASKNQGKVEAVSSRVSSEGQRQTSFFDTLEEAKELPEDHDDIRAQSDGLHSGSLSGTSGRDQLLGDSQIIGDGKGGLMESLECDDNMSVKSYCSSSSNAASVTRESQQEEVELELQLGGGGDNNPTAATDHDDDDNDDDDDDDSAQNAVAVERNTTAVEYADTAAEVEYDAADVDRAATMEYDGTVKVAEQVVQPLSGEEDHDSTRDSPKVATILAEVAEDAVELMVEIQKEQASPSQKHMVKVKEASARLAEDLLEASEEQKHYVQKKHLKQRLESRKSLAQSSKEHSAANSDTEDGDHEHTAITNASSTLLTTTADESTRNTNTKGEISLSSANIATSVREYRNSSDAGIANDIILPHSRITLDEDMSDTSSVTPSLVSRDSPTRGQAYADFEELEFSMVEQEVNFIDTVDTTVEQHHSDNYRDGGDAGDSNDESSMIEPEATFIDTHDTAIELEQHSDDSSSDDDNDNTADRAGDTLSTIAGGEDNDVDGSDDSSDDAVEASEGLSADRGTELDQGLVVNRENAVDTTCARAYNIDFYNEKREEGKLEHRELDMTTSTEVVEREAPSIKKAVIESTDTSSPPALHMNEEKVVRHDSPVRAIHGSQKPVEVEVDAQENVVIDSKPVEAPVVVDKSKLGSLKKKVAPSKKAAPHPPIGKTPFEREVYKIYSEHNPAKLDDVPTILKKWVGRESTLLSNLRKKYVSEAPEAQLDALPATSSDSQNAAKSSNGTITSEIVEAASISGPVDKSKLGSLKKKVAPSKKAAPHPPIGKTPFEREVYKIYSEHNPAKLDDVPIILKKWVGRESTLLSNLRKKYMSEPSTVQETTVAETSQTVSVKADDDNIQKANGKFKPKPPPTVNTEFTSTPISDSKEMSFANEILEEVAIPEDGDKDDVQFRLSRIEAFKAKRDALARRGSGHTSPASSTSPTRNSIGPPRPPPGPKPTTTATSDSKDTTTINAQNPQNPHLRDMKVQMSADSNNSDSYFDLDDLTAADRQLRVDPGADKHGHVYPDHHGPDWDASNDSGYADLTPEEIARRNLAAKAALLVAPTAPSVHLDYQDPALRTNGAKEKAVKEKFWAGPSLKKDKKKEKKEKN